MENDRYFNYALRTLFFMSLSLTIPLILIEASGWFLLLVPIVVFSSALCGSVTIAYIYRVLHNIILRPGLYIWALIATIRGPQDIIAIGFYIVFALQLRNIIGNLIGETLVLLSAAK